MLSSDHSPSTPDLKLMEEGNFLRAWGGISSLQVSLCTKPFAKSCELVQDH